MLKWKTYDTAVEMAINEFEYQVQDTVLIKAKKNKNYKIAHNNKTMILVLEPIYNVVYEGEYRDKRNNIVTNLELTCYFLTR